MGDVPVVLTVLPQVPVATRPALERLRLLEREQFPFACVPACVAGRNSPDRGARRERVTVGEITATTFASEAVREFSA